MPPRTVLIVDDDDALRALLAETVGDELGLEVATAASGPAALAAARALRPDVVLLDWDLPGLPGDRVAAALRGTGRRSCRIVGMTASASDTRAFRSLCDRFVAKPFDIEDLLQAVRGCLDGRGNGQLPLAGGEPTPAEWARHVCRARLSAGVRRVVQLDARGRMLWRAAVLRCAGAEAGPAVRPARWATA